MGGSYEQISKDYSKTTYSSARTAMIEATKRFMSMRTACPQKLANEIYSLWLEEDLDIVSGYPDNTVARFSEYPAAWVMASWLAPGKGEIDPLKQSQASANNLRIARTTHSDEAAELGKDWDDVVQTLAYENGELERLGISPVLDSNVATTEESTNDDQ